MRTRTRTRLHARRTQRGLATIECMLAIVVGATFIMGLVIFYMNSGRGVFVAETVNQAARLLAGEADPAGDTLGPNPFGGDWRLVWEGGARAGVAATGIPAEDCARLATAPDGRIIAARINDTPLPDAPELAWSPRAAVAACDRAENEIVWRLRRQAQEPASRI